MPLPVLEAVERHLRREAEIGGYEAEAEAQDRIGRTYDAVARLLGTEARNVAIVENATAAFSQAVSAFDFERGDVIVTTQNDYVSNQITYLSLAARRGVVVRRAAELAEGGADPDDVRRLLADPRSRLVAVSWVPTNSGLVQPAEAIGAICAERGVPYLVDACQAVGQMPVDVARLKCDFLSATARKFLRGPRGVGFLYVSDEALGRGAYPLYLDMRGADWTAADRFELAEGARRFENWEFPWALVLGMGAAAEYALVVGLAEAQQRAWGLAAMLRERLAAVPGVRLLDRGRTPCAIVTIGANGVDIPLLRVRLREAGINASVSERKVGVIDMDAKGAEAALRLSPHYYNTEQEIEAAVATIDSLLAASRS